MNATHSWLHCEHCHGTGYITTALSKLPCLTCSSSEFVSTGQDQSEVVSNRQHCARPAHISLPLIKQPGAIRKDPTNLARCSFLGFGFGVSWDGDCTIVEVLTVFANGKSCSPFTDVNTQIDLLSLDGHTKFFIGLWTGPVGRRLQKNSGRSKRSEF